MNREIKFRAWDKKLEQMHWNVVVLNGHCFDLSEMEEKPSFILMQYTGLKDRYGNEIYDRHIIFDEHYDEYGTVVFDEGKFIVQWETYQVDLIEVCDSVEVAGNIYENPELLKGEEAE